MSVAITAVIGIYANPQSLERAGDALVNSGGFSEFDICVFLPQEVQDNAEMETFLLSVICCTFQQARLAREIIECTDAQAWFSLKVSFLSADNVATSFSHQN
jgi:hypothetical protein